MQEYLPARIDDHASHSYAPLFALQLEEWQILAELRDATVFANWSRNKGGWDTLEEHHDPSRCAGVTMDGGRITEIGLEDSNLNGGEFSLGHMPRYRTTSATTNTHSVLPESIGGLSSLEELWVNDNKELKALPSTIGSLSKLKELHAYACGLSGRICF